MIRAILTDIEGTTSSISFVKDVLFPYAARELPEFVRAHRTDGQVRHQLDAAAELAGIPSHDSETVLRQLLQWIHDDVKATPLKALQGMLWKRGYESGAYKAHVYADAVQKLHEWYERQILLYVYSSGSVQAQQLFFRYSLYGDMRRLFSGWFDTTTGPKRDAESYRAICAEIGLPSSSILFLSDVVAELDAARAAGLHTCLLTRPEDSDSAAGSGSPPHTTARSFDDIRIDDFA